MKDSQQIDCFARKSDLSKNLSGSHCPRYLADKVNCWRRQLCQILAKCRTQLAATRSKLGQVSGEHSPRRKFRPLPQFIGGPLGRFVGMTRRARVGHLRHQTRCRRDQAYSKRASFYVRYRRLNFWQMTTEAFCAWDPAAW